jgi:hypothetical protein
LLLAPEVNLPVGVTLERVATHDGGVPGCLASLNQ